MPVQSSPTAQRRQLGFELRQLREAARLKSERAAEALECSPSKVSRIETGHVAVSLRDVRDLLDLYNANDQQRLAIIELAKEARQKSWLHAYSDVHPSAYLGFETGARSICVYEPMLVPGLLQTTEYARSLIHEIQPNLGPEEVNRWISLRSERQKLLRRRGSPAFSAILDEAVLRRSIGGREILRAQLGHLVEAAEWPSVTLQVMPFDLGEHGCLHGGFTILNFPDAAQPGLVFVEELTKELYLEGAEELRRYELAFERLSGAALKPDDSVNFIETVARELQKGLSKHLSRHRARA